MDVFFRRERERQIADIAKYFLMVVVLYRDVYGKYKNGTLKFVDVQRLVDDKEESILYNLKEACHNLFRQEGGLANSILDREKLFDLAIGSFFHEAMKVREDCYQLEFYSPFSICELEKNHSETVHGKELFDRIRNLASRVQERLPKEFEELDALLGDNINQFRALLVEHKNNGLLVRFLIENKQLVNQVFGPKGIKDLFQLMYTEGSVEAYTLAARSYFESGFYDKASSTIEKLQKSKKDDKGIKFLYCFYTGVMEYYKENYRKALDCLNYAAGLEKVVSIKDEDMQKIKSFCDKVKLALCES